LAGLDAFMLARGVIVNRFSSCSHAVSTQSALGDQREALGDKREDSRDKPHLAINPRAARHAGEVLLASAGQDLSLLYGLLQIVGNMVPGSFRFSTCVTGPAWVWGFGFRTLKIPGPQPLNPAPIIPLRAAGFGSRVWGLELRVEG
jgi:hypothetical protein